MFKIGDCVLHQKTGHFGKVVGYGHQILDSVYLPTLKVRVNRVADMNQGSFVEDLSSAWMQTEGE